MDWTTQGNTSLEEHLKIWSSRKTYISKTNQNILLNCCSAAITETIIKRVNDTQYFSILCDEAWDASDKEQLSFCLRYPPGMRRRSDVSFMSHID